MCGWQVVRGGVWRTGRVDEREGAGKLGEFCGEGGGGLLEEIEGVGEVGGGEGGGGVGGEDGGVSGGVGGRG